MDIAKFKQDIVFEDKLTFHSTWGLFSPKAVDEGTKVLINHLTTIKPTDVSIDIGCGYGAVGLNVAKMSPKGIVHMVDKDFVAVEFAKKNAELNGITNCQIYLSNGFSKVPKVHFDNVISNFPTNTGIELFSTVISDAKDFLKPGGKIYIVTINNLRNFIKRDFEEIFGNYEKLHQSPRYTVSSAIKN